MARLNERQIAAALRSLRGWKREGDALRRTIRRKDFAAAMGFVQSVALLAERMDHHPDIDIRWNTVTLVLSTRSEGGITHRDIDLAERINSLS